MNNWKIDRFQESLYHFFCLLMSLFLFKWQHKNTAYNDLKKKLMWIWYIIEDNLSSTSNMPTMTRINRLKKMTAPSGYDCVCILITIFRIKGVRLKMYVNNLYNICRKRWRLWRESHNCSVRDCIHQANYNWLWDLMQKERHAIPAFTKSIWKELINIVPMFLLCCQG